MDKYGIIGYPLGHTFSPQIHNPAFMTLGIEASYDIHAIKPESFDLTIQRLKEGDYKGFNITIPYKQRIIPFIDIIDPLAQKVNAVNTIKKAGNSWYGYNTDLYGFLLPIQNLMQNFKSALVVGAGGAANAVCFALADATVVENITIANRTPENATVLKERLNRFYDLQINIIGLDQEVSEKYDLIVNTTSVGMGKTSDKNSYDISSCYHDKTIVYDLIYNPKETLFLQIARSKKLKVINGLDMLIGQAAKSFFIWTGQEFPMRLIDKKIFYK
jgi:shikimate dehydrogenase